MLTVLFADLAGFTAASDGADVEDVHAHVLPWQELAREAVGVEAGTVARVLGDGIMAVWGYPVAREDDAERAVRAGLAMLAELRARLPALHARVGINTGEALVAFGSALEDADDAMGDAVNIAARFQSAAGLDTVLLGDATAALLPERYRLRRLEGVVLKGKAEPLVAHVVEGVSRAEPTPHAHASLAMVGRERELAQLLSVLRANPPASRALIIGEPGLGKSRLVGEARRRMGADGGAAWLTGRCREDARGDAWALGELLKAHAGITDEADPAEVHTTLDRMIPADEPDRDWLIERIGPLVGVRSGPPVDAEERRSSWLRLLRVMAAGGARVLVIEDAHWAEPGLAEFLSDPGLADPALGLRLVITSRPGGHVEERALGGPGVSRIQLRPLASEEAAVLSDAVTGMSALPDDLRAAIAARAGGNPLFTLELARLASAQTVAGGSLRADSLLPSSVQAVIGARLDLLSSGARSVVQDASAVGPVFWVGAMESMPGATRDGVLRALDELDRAELVRPIDGEVLGGERAYGFRHALVRDVAYSRLTRADRAVRHVAAADWIGAHVGPDRGDLAAVVGQHYVQALDYATAGATTIDVPRVRERAVEMLLRAATTAGSSPGWAAERFLAAADLLPAGSRRRGLALYDAGVSRMLDGALEEAAGIAHRLRDEAAAGDDPGILALAIAGDVIARALTGSSDGLEALKPSVDLIASLPLAREHVEIEMIVTLMESVEGTREGVIASADRAITMARTLGLPIPLEALQERGRALTGSNLPGGLADVAAAADEARRIGNAGLATRYESTIGSLLMYEGRFGEAFDAADQGRAEARRLGLPVREGYASAASVAAARLLGRWDVVDAALAWARHMSGPLAQTPTQGFLEAQSFWVALDRGDHGKSDEALAALVALTEGRPGRAELCLWPVRAALAGHAGDASGASKAVAAAWRQTPGECNPEVDSWWLPVGRALLAAGAREALADLASTQSNPTPMGQALRLTLDAQLAELDGRLDVAATLYGDVAGRWGSFGGQPEQAHALAGLARVSRGAGHMAASTTAAALARALFEQLGARAPLAAMDDPRPRRSRAL